MDTHPPIRLIRDMPFEEQPLSRIQHHGPRSINSAELLSLLIPGPYALDIANNLLSELGGLTTIAQASHQELEKTSGIGLKTAYRIHAALELGRRFIEFEKAPIARFDSPSDVGAYLLPIIGNLSRENFVLLTINSRNEIINLHTIYVGTINTTVLRISELFLHAIKDDAVAIMVAHNHPSGDPNPSPDDVFTTNKIIEAGKLLDFMVLDHIVVSRTNYVSLRDRKLCEFH